MATMDWCGKPTDWLKECTKCKKECWVEASTFEAAWELMTEYFPRSIGGTNSDALSSDCHSCNSARRHNRENKIHRDEMLEAQDGKCALCFVQIQFNGKGGARVDHDHKSGNDRGVLCISCNRQMASVDDDEWLARAITYRNKFR
jgi:hypothetical protein